MDVDTTPQPLLVLPMRDPPRFLNGFVVKFLISYRRFYTDCLTLSSKVLTQRHYHKPLIAEK